MAKVVVAGGAVMDFILRVPSWPQPSQAVQGRFSAEPGGKGLNQSVAAARLGADTAIISAMGDDPYGKEIREILRHERVKLHVDVQEVLSKEDGTDVTAVILPTDGHPGFIGCRRATEKLTPKYVEQAIDAIKKADVVLVTFDASIEAAQKVIELAKEAHKPIIINPAPPMEVPLTVLDGVDYVIPNEWEAREWVRLSAPELLESPSGQLSDEEVGYKLVEQGAKVVIITLGLDGCLVVDRRGARHYPAFKVDAVDTTGASDAFCAGLAVAFARSLDRRKGPKTREQEMISFASAAGAQACTRYGALRSMPSLDDVTAFLETHASLKPVALPEEHLIEQQVSDEEPAPISAKSDG